MERVANIVSGFANRIAKSANQHLYFEFTEQSGFQNGRFHRSRRVTSDFALTEEFERSIREWLVSDRREQSKVRLTNDKIDVVISWKKSVHKEGRTFSSMPAIAYHKEDNPIYRRLQEKRSQLSGVPKGALKCIFLGDAGCNALHDLKPINQGSHAVSGEQIIWHFLDRAPIDLVAVFSPQRQNMYDFRSRRIWRVTYFDKRNASEAAAKSATDALEYVGLQNIASKLPAPQYEGYQARSLHRQGSFDPQARGQYLGWAMSTRGGLMTAEIKLSARLVLEYLSGRITLDQFRHFGGNPDALNSMLSSGQTLKEVRIESAGVDEDDDYFVFTLDIDPAASPLKPAGRINEA